MKVSIANFQSLSHVELEFEPGITLISGPTDSGKTAVFRALLAAILNKQGTKGYIQHGKSGAGVKIEYGGHELVWKRKASVSYTFDGQTYSRASKLTLNDIWPDSPFLVADKECINFHREHSALFPFGYNARELYDLFESFLSISQINDVQKEAKSDIRNEQDKLKLIDAQLGDDQRKLSLINSVDIDAVEEQLKELVTAASDAQTVFQMFSGGLAGIEKDLETLEHLAPVAGFSDIDIPNFHEVAVYQDLVSDWDAICAIPAIDVPDDPAPSYPDTDYQALLDDREMIKWHLSQIKNCKESEQTLEAELQQLTEGMKTCPLCGSFLDQSHMENHLERETS